MVPGACAAGTASLYRGRGARLYASRPSQSMCRRMSARTSSSIIVCGYRKRWMLSAKRPSEWFARVSGVALAFTRVSGVALAFTRVSGVALALTRVSGVALALRVLQTMMQPRSPVLVLRADAELLLHRTKRIAMNSLPTTSSREPQAVLEVVPGLRGWVRGSLLGLALALLGVFAVAAWLNPYNADGSPRTLATHQQLGLPPCNFYFVTGLPCPACGMTTSFALLIHGDLRNSLRANAVGTLLAGFCLLLIPWCLASAIWQRTLFIRSVERTLTLVVLAFLSLMLLRWIIVLGLTWWMGTPFPG